MKIILLLLAGGIMCSCSQNMLLDKQGKEDLMVCSGACVVSSSIRKDAETLAAFQKASDIIRTIIKNDQVTRDELQAKLTKALSKLFSKQIVDKVVSEIMNVYDENMAKIHDNEKLMMALKSAKSAIDSGIQLAIKTGRPVKVVPKA